MCQERVVNEKKYCDDLLEKLNQFFLGDLYNDLPVAEKDRLKRQAKAMEDYSCVLGERIANFSISRTRRR